MTQETFNRVVNERCRLIQTVLAAKAKEYARGDRLHNFKRAAGFMNKTAETACFHFAMKHFTSIADMVDDIEQGLKPTENYVSEKIGDAINYLILLEALIADTRIMEEEFDKVTHQIVETATIIAKKKARKSR